VSLDRAAVEAALAAFRGAIRQVPPAYSALKHQGRSHYEYARAGIDVPRAAREVRIAALTLTSVEAARRDARRRVQQGDVHPRTCRRPGRRARLRGAPGRVAARSYRRILDRRRRRARCAGGADAGRARASAAAGRYAPGRAPRLAVDAADAQRLRDGRAIGPVEGAPECCRAYAPDGTLLGVIAREGDMLTPQRMARTTV
jgi:tRNA pseudouridine55 synthase